MIFPPPAAAAGAGAGLFGGAVPTTPGPVGSGGGATFFNFLPAAISAKNPPRAPPFAIAVPQ